MVVVKFTEEHIGYVTAMQTLFAREVTALAREYYHPGFAELQIERRNRAHYEEFFSENTQRRMYLALDDDGFLQGLLEAINVGRNDLVIGCASWTLVRNKRAGYGKALHQRYQADCRGDADIIEGSVAIGNTPSLKFCASLGFEHIRTTQSSYILWIPMSDKGRRARSRR